MRPSLVIAALVAALVGFAGTLALVIAAARAVGASPAETASWISAVCLAKAASSTILSVRHRLPIITAWSTPGAALIAAGGGAVAFPEAVGAFLLAALLVLLTAAVRPLAQLVARLPPAIASAMLAGILFTFALEICRAATLAPTLVLPLVILFLVLRRWSPMGAVLALLVAGVGLAYGLGLATVPDGPWRFASLELVAPAFSPSALIGLGLPLYLVTMASQNLPGFAVLRAAGYPVPARSILGWTGLGSLVSAFAGAHTTNLAAITAAICTGPDAHPDPNRRWQAGPVYGAAYLALAALGPSTVNLFAALPPVLVTTIAGLALLGPLVGALGAAFAPEPTRLPAALTFTLAASGLAIAGIGAAFWGLLLGLVALWLERRR